MMTLIIILLICILLAVLSLNPKINIWAEMRGIFGLLLGLLFTVVICGAIVLATYWVWKRYPEKVANLIFYGLIVYGVYYVFRKPINKAWDKYQEKKARNHRED